mmetsp:Transcript_54552/g.145673  ORF Transcript_54552/g.145673 Transcript_54552/m.145673 type:complete len:266 (-) Transcript_54552:1478-2275(-)
MPHSAVTNLHPSERAGASAPGMLRSPKPSRELASPTPDPSRALALPRFPAAVPLLALALLPGRSPVPHQLVRSIDPPQTPSANSTPPLRRWNIPFCTRRLRALALPPLPPVLRTVGPRPHPRVLPGHEWPHAPQRGGGDWCRSMVLLGSSSGWQRAFLAGTLPVHSPATEKVPYSSSPSASSASSGSFTPFHWCHSDPTVAESRWLDSSGSICEASGTRYGSSATVSIGASACSSAAAHRYWNFGPSPATPLASAPMNSITMAPR